MSEEEVNKIIEVYDEVIADLKKENQQLKEDIKNIHYNHHNEIQFEYGGQTHHHSMESLKEVFVSCWNLQQKLNQYENPEDLTLFYMWLDEKAKDKMKELELENQKLTHIIEELEKYLEENKYFYSGYQGEDREDDLSIIYALDKLKQLKEEVK